MVSINYFIDPYLLYGTERFVNLNDIKPSATSHSRQSKLHLAHEADINGLIIGNSRPEMGLDPDHSYFTDNNIRMFNLGSPGSGLNEQYGHALDISRAKEIKKIIIGVDFSDYLIPLEHTDNPYKWPPEKSNAELRRKLNWDGTDNSNYLSQYIKDIYIPLIALGTFQDSVLTLFGQNNAFSNLQNNGFNPANDMDNATRTEGVKTIFQQKIPTLVDIFTSPKKIYTDGYEWSPAFTKLVFLLDYLDTNKIETKIFINPYHIQYIESIERSGLGGEFTKWKKSLMKAISNSNQNGTIELWNFSDPSIYTTEPILKSGREPLKWFWEPAHYNRILGDILISRMYEDDSNNNGKLTNFGYKMTPSNINESLLSYQDNLQKYRDLYPKETNFIASYYSKK